MSDPDHPAPWWRDDGWRGLPLDARDDDPFDPDRPDAADLAEIRREQRERDR